MTDTPTLAGLKRKLDELYTYVQRLEERPAAPPATDTTQTPPAAHLSPRSADRLRSLHAAAAKGRALPLPSWSRGKWDANVTQRKCHGQWLDSACFDTLHLHAVWSAKAWHSLEGVKYLTGRDGEAPKAVLMCPDCVHTCPACPNLALRSELQLHGLCGECGKARTALLLREQASQLQS